MLLIESRSVEKRDLNDLTRQRFWLDQEPTLIAFFCECTDHGCYRPVWLTGPVYDTARRDPAWVALAEVHTTEGTLGHAA